MCLNFLTSPRHKDIARLVLRIRTSVLCHNKAALTVTSPHRQVKLFLNLDKRQPDKYPIRSNRSGVPRKARHGKIVHAPVNG